MPLTNSFEHVSKISQRAYPAFRYDGSADFATWQKVARETLSDLLCLEAFEKCDDNFTVEYQTEHEDFTEIRFLFNSEEDFVVPCHILLPKKVAAPFTPVICIQGHSTGMHISLGRAKFPGDEQTIAGGDRDFAIRAVKEGCAAITLDQRYMGEQGGTENGTGCYSAALVSMLYGRTAIGERVWDVCRLIDVLEKHFDCLNMERLVCLGNSGGGTATFYIACMDERVYCAVPSCSVCTYKDSIGAMHHCCCNHIPKIGEYFDMGDLTGLIAPRKLVIVNGRKDAIFPQHGVEETMEIAKEMFSAAGVPENVTLVTGEGGHRFYADLAWPVIHNYLDR